MRLFVAITPPAQVLDEVAGTAGGLCSAAGELRWSSRDDWHLTLLFLGEVAQDDLPGLREHLAEEAARHARPRLAVRGAGTFPGDDTRAGVLWAGIEGDLDGLGALAAGLRKAARTAGFGVERRAYVPHLTLARSRRPTDMSTVRAALSQLTTCFWTVDDVHLMHSRPGGEPRYTTVATWRLS
ncbi:MAG: RNA 2',3'-cyclic phosphodiesterase [Nocardiopsaceae bacterium]|mgnify:CR=1 FL=1|nr:RNA 2',3'-cyclic phosphodiesterase [Nocardiopsaceae bacterium]